MYVYNKYNYRFGCNQNYKLTYKKLECNNVLVNSWPKGLFVYPGSWTETLLSNLFFFSFLFNKLIPKIEASAMKTFVNVFVDY